MTVSGWIELVVLVLVLTGLKPIVGGYMARVYQGERVLLTRVVVPGERAARRRVIEPTVSRLGSGPTLS
jgi:potassium-transporting ATPase potassium-binding subunit